MLQCCLFLMGRHTYMYAARSCAARCYALLRYALLHEIITQYSSVVAFTRTLRW